MIRDIVLEPSAQPFKRLAGTGNWERNEGLVVAERTITWFAASRDPRARALADRWWTLLRQPGRAQAQTLRPDGSILDPAAAPLPLVAAAAAAWAALGPALLRGALRSAC